MAGAADVEAVQRRAEALRGLRAIRAVGAHLGDQRVVEQRDVAALDDARIDPDALARGLQVALEPTGRGQKAARRVLGVDPGLDRPAVLPDVVLGQRERLPGRDAQHLLDQIEAGCELGHRVLDLEARVHLEEIEAALGVDDALDRAGRAVADRARERHRLLAHRAPRRRVEERARRLLDHLLMAALDRAFALAEVDRVAVAVGEHLDLDVARLAHELLEEHAIVAEGRARLAARALDAGAQIALVERHAHALAAPARGRLDHHRVADLGRDAGGELEVADRLPVPGDHVDAGFRREALGRELVAHHPDRVRRRTDEGDPCRLERLGERGVLGQKAIARMDRLGAGLPRRRDDLLDPEIALGRGRRPDRDRLIGHADVQRVGVGLRVDRDRRDAEPPAGPDHAAGDLAAIGDQELVEHSQARFPADWRANLRRPPRQYNSAAQSAASQRSVTRRGGRGQSSAGAASCTWPPRCRRRAIVAV